MVRLFVSGIVFGAVLGAAAVSCWALAAAAKLHRKDEKPEEAEKPEETNKPEETEKPLDITPQLAAGAANVIHQYCRQQQSCEECTLFEMCDNYFNLEPECWK